MMFGLSAALYEHVDLIKGEVQETNFDTYRVLRMADVPVVEIKLIATDNPADRHGRAGRARRRTGHRQCGRNADRR